ncbi:MAG: SUMF1/EgtB/PvdO family nonheme iron enzyme [Saprospiraceae bacterium]|nr:SUMF1/EgtB/PvdO family nonheme iron enzyme [Saprospiraceae bacterium]
MMWVPVKYTGLPKPGCSEVKKPCRPNSLGLHDMSGNAWEWCWDWYSDYPPAPPLDYTGPESGSSRCLRGGSWVSDYSVWFEVGDRYYVVQCPR